MIDDVVADDFDIELEQLMRGFDPTGDRVDAILLQCLTGDNDSQALKDWECRTEVGTGDEEEDFLQTQSEFAWQKKVSTDNMSIQKAGTDEKLL